jgi:tagatose-1,6-bisphosphate aldolase
VEKAAKRKLAKHFPYFALAALLLLALCAAGYLVFKTKESARKQNIAKAPPISRRSFDPEAHNKVEKYRKAYSISNDKKQFDALTATIDILEKYDHKQLPKEDLNTLKMYLYYRGNGYDIMCQPPNKIEASKVVAMSNNYVKAAELIEESKLRSKVDKDILDVEYIKIKAATEAFPGDHASTYKLLNDFSVITRVCKGKDSAEFALVKQQLSEFLKQHPECKDLD